MSTENDFYNGVTRREVEAEIKADHQSITLQQQKSSFIKFDVTLYKPCINLRLYCVCYVTDDHPVMWRLIGFLALTSLVGGL